MKTTLSICAVAAQLVLGTVLVRAQSGAGTLPPTLVTIDENTTSDTQRATLVKAIAAEVPEDRWKTVTIRRGDSLTGLINKYYGIYSTKDRSNPYSQPLPQTTQSMMQLIRDANNLDGDVLTAGKPLRLPPIPVRPKNGEAVPDVVRAFDPKTDGAYALVGASAIRGFAGSPASPPRTKDQLQPVRAARTTFVALSSDNPMLSDAFAASAATARPSVNNVDLATVPVRLLGRTDALCAESAAVLTTSPYLAAAKARVTAALPAMQAAMKTRHLTLIDFDFKGDHGAWVRSVAGLILKTFGATSLAATPNVNDSGIRISELNPRVAKADLDDALTDYYTNAGLDVQAAGLASLWILTASGEVGQAIHKVNVSILQAVLWRALSRGDIVNMSWQVDNTTGIKTLQMDDLLSTKRSAIVVAAGNDEGQEISDRFPQSEGLRHPEFVNVTYGSVAGEPFGSITGTNLGGRVDVLATGCGLDAPPVQPGYYGSSLAAPIVATSAWLRMLLDSGTSSIDIRREVMKASLLVPPQPKAITIGGGIFDPARLIANPGAHYLDSQRRNMTAITALDLDADRCGRLTLSSGAPTSDAIVYKDGSKYLLLRRQQLNGFAGVQVIPPCELTTLRGSLTTAGGSIPITDAASFVSRIGHLTY